MSTQTQPKFQRGQLVVTKSGKTYRIWEARDAAWNTNVTGEPVYGVSGIRNGKRYGPYRCIRESSIVAVVEVVS